MVRDNLQSLYSDHPVPGLRHRILSAPASKISGNKLPKGSNKILGHGILFKRVDSTGGHSSGAPSRTGAGVLFPCVFDKETHGKVQDDPKSKTLEQISQVQEVQDGFYFLGQKSIDARLFHGINRFKGCLFAHPDLPTVPEVSQTSGEEGRGGSTPTVQGSSFRALVLTPDFHQGDGGGLSSASSAGGSSNPLFRRPVVFCPFKGKVTGRLD